MRDYDRQIVLHVNVESNATPKTKWDKFRDPTLNDNINMWDKDSQLQNKIKLSQLTNQSRIYIVGHGMSMNVSVKDREYVYIDAYKRVHCDEFVRYIGANATSPSLKTLNDRVLRISLVVCYASLGPFPQMLHQRLKEKYGIFSEVIARPDVVVFNRTHGIKYARRDDRSIDGKAPKQIYKFIKEKDYTTAARVKQIKDDVAEDQLSYSEWNTEAVILMNDVLKRSREGSLPEFKEVLKNNQGDINRYHIKYANEQLVKAMTAVSKRAPKTTATEKTLELIQNMISRCPAR